MSLQLLICEPNLKPNYREIYENAFFRKLDDLICDPCNKQVMKQTVFLGIKFIGRSHEHLLEFRQIESRLKVINLIHSLLEELTALELIEMFPITKDYDGKRFESKDYFYTMDFLRKFGLDRKLKNQVDEVLWEYTNRDIRLYAVNRFGVIDDFRRANGGPGMIEEFLADIGIGFQTLSKDAKGRQYLTDSKTGKTVRVRKKIPRYLRPL